MIQDRCGARDAWVACPSYKKVPEACSLWYINVPRACSPAYLKGLRAGSPWYIGLADYRLGLRGSF